MEWGVTVLLIAMKDSVTAQPGADIWTVAEHCEWGLVCVVG